MTLEVILGHGASGNAASMAPWVDGLRLRGLAARAIDLPRRRAEEAVPAFLAAVAPSTAAGVAPGGEGSVRTGLVLGGHSFGGRVASLAASRLLGAGEGEGEDEAGAVSGVLLLSYPLHAPGRPESWRERTEHWPAISCPVLLLSGEADPFARLPLLREAVERLPRARLVTYPRVGHGLLAVLDEALSEAVDFIRGLPNEQDRAD